MPETLYEIINGETVAISEERAAVIRAAWEAKQSAPRPAPRWSFLEFMERFTQAEQEAIAGAAMANVQVKLWYDKAVGAKEIIADEPRTVAGMDALVAAGLLTQARRDEILGG